jgi:hypothetical protein
MNDLLKLKNDLVIKKMKLDKFFSMYLEKFERKMDPDNTNTPIWKLYKAKLKEYGDIAQQLRNTDYYIKREQQYV